MEENKPKWFGFTTDLKHIPLDEIRRDGFDVELRRDEVGEVWHIIRKELLRTLEDRKSTKE